VNAASTGKVYQFKLSALKYWENQREGMGSVGEGIEVEGGIKEESLFG